MTEKKTRKRATELATKVAEVQPRTQRQRDAMSAWNSGRHLLMTGSAGTGKTLLSIFMALKAIEAGDYDSLAIVRSIVPTRDPGFLPGSLKEKTRIYEDPYRALLNDLYDRVDAWDFLRNKGSVDLLTTSFVRGITLRNKVVFVDEVQNMSFHEIDSVVTRIGDGCRLVVVGDSRQSDLKDNGMAQFERVVDRMSCFAKIEFRAEDVVRSGFVKEYLTAREEEFPNF